MEPGLTALEMAGQDQRLDDTVRREQGRLRRFIRARVGSVEDAEDILQDVLYELVEAARLMKPVEHVSAWMFRVARNRITDLFRRRRPDVSIDAPVPAAEDGPIHFEDLLPSPEGGPEAAYARSVLLDELEAALEELPDNQREVFVAHELEGRSFKDIAAATGINVNTLLARKHYAVLHLRRRLEAIRDEWQDIGRDTT